MILKLHWLPFVVRKKKSYRFSNRAELFFQKKSVYFIPEIILPYHRRRADPSLCFCLLSSQLCIHTALRLPVGNMGSPALHWIC